jgi:hypothetical protein
MKYMLIAYDRDFHQSPPEEQQRRVRQHRRALGEFIASRRKKALVLASIGLNSLPEVITLKNQGGSFPTVAGPFAETKEVVGGFDIIDFDSRDEALEFAAHEHTHAGHVAEVRPILDMWWSESVGAGAPLSQRFMIAYLQDETIGMQQTPEQIEECVSRREKVANEYLARRLRRGESAFWAGARLDWSRNSTTFRIGAKGSYTKFDGPFAETKEVLGGFAILSCTREEALEWTRKLLPRDGDIASITPVNSFSWFYHGLAS